MRQPSKGAAGRSRPPADAEADDCAGARRSRRHTCCAARMRRRNADIAPYQQAKINWRQAEGEEITIAFIPASYFDNLIALQPTFEALSGARNLANCKRQCSTFENGDVRNVGDRSDAHPLYVSNKWVEPLDKYLGDSALTDAAWFNYDDILKARRDANSYEGKPYAIPYDGEVTVQVYRKDPTTPRAQARRHVEKST